MLATAVTEEEEKCSLLKSQSFCFSTRCDIFRCSAHQVWAYSVSCKLCRLLTLLALQGFTFVFKTSAKPPKRRIWVIISHFGISRSETKPPALTLNENPFKFQGLPVCSKEVEGVPNTRCHHCEAKIFWCLPYGNLSLEQESWQSFHPTHPPTPRVVFKTGLVWIFFFFSP